MGCWDDFEMETFKKAKIDYLHEIGPSRTLLNLAKNTHFQLVEAQDIIIESIGE